MDAIARRVSVGNKTPQNILIASEKDQESPFQIVNYFEDPDQNKDEATQNLNLNDNYMSNEFIDVEKGDSM